MARFQHAWHGLSPVVIGVDGCPNGWVGLALDHAGSCSLVVGPTVASVVAQVPGVEVVAVDIPIGLSVDRPRLCDQAAKQALGARSSTVFLTPVRAALEAPTYAEANAVSRALTGAGISTQAYALRKRILEVDRWMRDGAGVDVYEAHPELSFARMAGRVVASSKHRPDGLAQRQALLLTTGFALPPAPGIPLHDLLDAAACAWTARRIAAGCAETTGPAHGPFITA